MILNPNQSLKAQQVEKPVSTSHSSRLVTLFTLPKPFEDPHTSLIQTNAIASWAQLPDTDVILMGNEFGIEETAKEFGTQLAATIKTNDYGTPLLSDAFRLAHEMSDSPLIIYCNSDVILLPSLIESVKQLAEEEQLDSFVGFGRRMDLRYEKTLNVSDPNWVENILAENQRHGRQAPVVCKEYFAFTRGVYETIPEFAVGRGNWDNWMIANAKSRGIPVVDLSEQVTIIHQEHDYKHINTSRFSCYVSGAEAKNNQQLAGGRNVVTGSTGTWKLGRNGLKKKRAAWLNGAFWKDLPRFARMVIRLPFQR